MNYLLNSGNIFSELKRIFWDFFSALVCYFWNLKIIHSYCSCCYCLTDKFNSLHFPNAAWSWGGWATWGWGSRSIWIWAVLLAEHLKKSVGSIVRQTAGEAFLITNMMWKRHEKLVLGNLGWNMYKFGNTIKEWKESL